jgi:uncharacterized protein (TIGR03435 family)
MGRTLVSGVMLAVVVGTCISAQSQTDRKPLAFDVASVKEFERPLPPGQADLSFVGTSGKPFRIVGHRVTIQGTVHALVAAAFGVKDYQVSYLPPWADSVRYLVTAESPGEAVPSQDDVRPMLQALLAERFQLTFHRESKELRVYHLVRAKQYGLFKAAAEDEKFSWTLTPGPGGTLRSKATKESIGDFVQLVGVSTDRPVIDKTGITGDIDYDISIQLPQGGNPEETNRAIVYAVVDQLGLKLESARASVDVLVIDHVERPTPD